MYVCIFDETASFRIDQKTIDVLLVKYVVVLFSFSIILVGIFRIVVFMFMYT